MTTKSEVETERRGNLSCIGREIIEVRVSKVYATVFSIIMLWFAVTIVLVFEGVSPGKIDYQLDNLDRWMFLGGLVLVVVAHEALHGFAAMLWGDVPFSSIQFGFKWKWFAPYCHCASPLRMGVFRVFLLLPLTVTTAITGLVLLLDPSLWSLSLFSLTFTGGAGDILIYFRVQDIPGDLWVQDHPLELGCYIWPEGQTPPV